MSSNKTVIAVDAMGGDLGPSVVVPGAIEAARQTGQQGDDVVQNGALGALCQRERQREETVAYQKSLAQELRRLSLLPIININTSKDKVTRAMRRSANFENHKVYFREGMDDLEECLLLFPEVDHDDLFDALDFAMTMADGGNEIRVLKREDFRI